MLKIHLLLCDLLLVASLHLLQALLGLDLLLRELLLNQEDIEVLLGDHELLLSLVDLLRVVCFLFFAEVLEVL